MGKPDASAISRREFARRAAFVSAAASLAPTNLLAAEVPAAATSAPQQPATASKLSPESQSEVDSRIQTILSRYGSRFSDAQKADIRRLATEAQSSLERLREFSTANGGGSGLYLKPLIEHERKAAPFPPKPASQPAAKNP